VSYGYGFNALRDGHDGAHSLGMLYQYNFEQRKYRHAKAKRTINGDSAFRLLSRNARCDGKNRTRE
jgi:hypothetical protein